MQTTLLAPTRTEVNGNVQKGAEAVCMVYRTHNYDIFKLMTDNRDINLLHVKRLVQSFQEQHLVCPIIVNEKMQVIDGQHRLRASMETGMPVYYIVLPGYTIKQVQILNTNQKNWNRMDFLEMYCEQGKEAYVELKIFMSEFPDFGINAAMCLIRLNGSGRKQGVVDGQKMHMKDFEEGLLQIPNITKSYVIARKVLDFKPFYKEYHRPGFVAAVIPLFSSRVYNHKEMLHKLKNCPDDLKLRDSKKVLGYRLQLEDIYNHRRAKDNKVSFKYE